MTYAERKVINFFTVCYQGQGHVSTSKNIYHFWVPFSTLFYPAEIGVPLEHG